MLNKVDFFFFHITIQITKLSRAELGSVQAAVLLVKIVFFHGIARKAIQEPTPWRVWYGKIYSTRQPLGFQRPISASGHGKGPTLSSLRPKQRPVSRVSVSYWNLELWGPATCRGPPVAAKPARTHVPRWETTQQAVHYPMRQKELFFVSLRLRPGAF